jgi:methyl-accepting chemotaxis protein
VLVKEIRPAQKKWMTALEQLGALEDKMNAQMQVDAAVASPAPVPS